MGNLHSKPYFDKCVELASPEIKQFLSKEDDFVKKILFDGCSILDVGCGYGRTIEIIHKIPSEIVGIDNSKRMVRDAKLNLKKCKNVKILFMDAFDIKLKQKFDFVLCLMQTFGNFSSNKLKSLKEMKRVLKKDGKMVIHVYNPKSFKIRLEGYKKVGMLILKIEKDGTIHSSDGFTSEQFTKKKLEDLFSKAKLDVKIRLLTPISYICIAEKS